MGRRIKIAAYVFGVIIILGGVLFVTEAALESTHTQNKVANIIWYPVIGAVLIIIGILLCYLGYRSGRSTKPQV